MANIDAYQDTSRQDRSLAIGLQLLFAITPIQFLMVYVGDTQFTAGMALSAVFGCVGLAALASSQLGLGYNDDRPILYALCYLGVCALSIATTPYGPAAVTKGLANLLAMLTMVAMALVLVRILERSPELFGHLARVYVIAAGIGGATGIYQSLVANIFGAPGLFDLKEWSGLLSGQDWWKPAIEGGITRAQGLYQEPSHVVEYLGPALGLSIMRLGLLGSQWRQTLERCVPTWAAFSVIGCILLTLSAVCYAALLLSFAALHLSMRNVGMKLLVTVSVVMTIAVGLVSAIVLNVGFGILERLVDLSVLAQLGDSSAEPGGIVGEPVNLSVAILFLNAEVAIQNVLMNPLLGAGLGAHPFAYDALVSDYAWINPFARGFNSQDASALLLRVLSETGVLGFIALSSAMGSAYWRGRRVVLAALRDKANPEFTAVSIALCASLIGLLAALLIHIPRYYSTPLWTLFALVCAIPVIAPTYLQRSSTAATGA